MPSAQEVHNSLTPADAPHCSVTVLRGVIIRARASRRLSCRRSLHCQTSHSPLSYRCHDAVVVARRRVARLLGCEPEEVYFTSCGSESDNWAVMGAVEVGRRRLDEGGIPHVVTTAVEHPAVLNPLRLLAERGVIELAVVSEQGTSAGRLVFLFFSQIVRVVLEQPHCPFSWLL
jgi:hypothetical protein